MKPRLLLAVGLASALALSACATQRQASTSSADVRGVTSNSVTVGGLLFKTTSFGLSNADEEVGAKAAFMAANAAGGVNGRKINYIGAKDDTGDPAKDTAAARELVDKDNVFAVVPATSFALSGSSYLEQQQTPYVGYGYSSAYCNSAWGFGYNGCVSPEPGPGVTGGAGAFTSLGDQLGGAKGKTIGFVQPDTPDQRKIAALGKAAAEAAGFTVTYDKTNVPQTGVSDWTPYVQAVLTSNNGKAPDIVVSYMSTSDNVNLFPALRAAGYHGPVADLISYGPKLLTDHTLNSAFQNAYLGIPVEPISSSSANVTKMKKWLQKATGKQDVPYTVDMGVGYASAQVFLEILKKAGKDLTPDSFKKAASNISITDSIGGPVSFPQAHSSWTGCYAYVQLTGKSFKNISPMTCKPQFNYSH